MTTLFTDSGVGSNANPIGGAYTTLTGFGAMQRLSNVVVATTSSADAGAYINSVTPGNDQWMQAAVSGLLNGGGVMVRAQTGSASGYLFQVYGGGTIELARFDSGAYTTIASGSTSHTPGDVYYIEAVGTTIKGFKNAVQVLSTTDATYSSGRLGVYGWATTGNNLTLLEGGDFSSGGIAIPVITMQFRQRLQ